MRSIDEGCAANDEYLSLADGVHAGELVWDLLHHRVKMPRPLSTAILRAGVDCRVKQALQPGSVLHVEAPAGYGKSQALSGVLADFPVGSVCWVRLNAQDNDPSRLLALLMLVLGLAELRHQPSTRSGSLADALTLLLAKFTMSREGDGPAVLVLDDVGRLVSAPALALLEQLIEELPTRISLVLLSRGPLPMETHAYALEGRFHRLSTGTLELSRAETLEYFEEEIHSGLLTLLAAEHLYTLTEGWLTPLALYRQELQAVAHERVSIRETRSVQRFLQDTLFGRLTAAQRRSLCLMAEFDVVCDDLFHHVIDRECDRSFSPSVAADAGLPIFPVPGRGRWFRFNPLVRDWLRARGVGGEQRRAAIAGEWFEFHGEYSEALRYALVSDNMDHALALAAHSSEALLVSQDTASLLELRRCLPPHLVLRSPRLRVVYGWVHAIGGQFTEARKLIDGLSRSEEQTLSGRVSALRAFILRGEGEVEASLAEADLALTESGLTVHGRLIALLMRSSALCAEGRFADARQTNRIASRLARESGCCGCEMLAVYDHAGIELAKGNLKHSEQLLRHGLDAVMSDPARPARVGEGRLQLSLALVLWHQGRLDEADGLLINCARNAEQARDLGFLMAMALRTLIAKARGRMGEAFSLIGQAERTMQVWMVDDPVYVPVLEGLKVACWLNQKQYESAEAALVRLRKHGLTCKVPELFPTLPGMLDTMQVRYDLACGQGDAALAHLRSLAIAGAGSAQPLFGLQLYGRLLEALSWYQSGKTEKACAMVSEAVVKAADEHYLSPFVELKEELARLMSVLLATLPDSAFRISLAAFFGSNRPLVRPLAEPISDRERRVLELIAMGLSNQDIGDKLHISLHTVKTHARRINAKLEVKSRTQATVRARELGLL